MKQAFLVLVFTLLIATTPALAVGGQQLDSVGNSATQSTLLSQVQALVARVGSNIKTGATAALCLFNIGSCNGSQSVSAQSQVGQAAGAADLLFEEQQEELPPESTPPIPTVVNNITNPVVERVIHTREIVREPGTTLDQFATEVDIKLNELRKELYKNTASSGQSEQNRNIWRAISLSQKIDSLSGATITDSPISGSTGSFTTLTATGDITVTGTVDGRDIAADGTALDTIVANNSTDVTLAGVLDYITIVGQTITRNAIDLAADITGVLGISNGGTGASTAAGARANLGVDASGTNIYGANGTLTGNRTVTLSTNTLNFAGTGTGDFSVNTDDLFVDTSSGNVGIGSTNPTASLQINSTATTNYGLSVNSDSLTTGYLASFYSNGTDTSSRRIVSIVNDNTAATGAISLYVRQDSTADIVNIFDGGTEVLTILDGGNVGIGTTSPSQLLHLYAASGAARQTIQSDSAGVGIYLDKQNLVNDSFIEYKVDGTSEWKTGMSGASGDGFVISEGPALNPRLFIEAGGNVGIGTTTPVGVLHAIGTGIIFERNESDNNGRWTQQVRRTRADSTPPNAGFGGAMGFALEGYSDNDIVAAASVGAYWETNQIDDTTARDSYLGFSTMEDNTLSERIRINSSGNVGIGTTSPGSKLHVYGGNIQLEDNYYIGLNSQVRTLYGSGNVTNTAGNSIYAMIDVDGNATTNTFSVRANNSSTDVFSVREDGQGYFAGNVGIGTTTPSASLDVVGGYVRTNQDFEQSDGTNGFRMHSRVANSYDFWQLAPITAGSVDWTKGIALERATGNVGIGITTPEEKLHVVGSDASDITAYVRNTGAGDSRIRLRDVGGDFIIRTDTAGGLRIYDNADARDVLTVDSSGDVGIGTTTPTGKLHINQDSANEALFVAGGSGGVDVATFVRDVGGNTTVGINGNSDNAQMYFTTTGNTFALGTDGSSFKISDNGTLGTNDRLTIDSSGNVGIGTTSPSTRLDVIGASSADVVKFDLVVASANTILELSSDDGVIGAGSNFLKWSDGGTTLGVIRGNGNLGIGTTAPSSLLEISGSQGTMTINDTRDTTFSVGDTIGAINFTSADDSSSLAGATRGSIELITENTFGSSHGLAFSTRATGAFSEKMRIDASGNVGIGTTAPTEELQIGDADTTDGGSQKALVITGNATGSAEGGEIQIQMAADYDTTYDNYVIDVFEDDLRIRRSGVGSDFILTSVGNVGIGDTTPSYKLDVNGDVQLGGNINNTAMLTFNGSSYTGTMGMDGTGLRIAHNSGSRDIRIVAGSAGVRLAPGGTSWTSLSDERLKKNISDISGQDALEKLAQIRSVTFNWEDQDWNTDQQVGVIAQDVLDVFPQLVQSSNIDLNGVEGDYYAVDYSMLVSPLIAGVNELWAKVTKNISDILSNTNRITQLENELAEVKAQLAASGASGGTSSGGDDTDDTPVETTPFTPTITILGNNPAEVEVGADYSDLGATAQNPDGNDISITLSVDGTDVQSIDLDTTTDITYTIEYKVQWEGEEATATREVIVGTGIQAPEQGPEQPTDTTNPADTPAEPDDAPDDDTEAQANVEDADTTTQDTNESESTPDDDGIDESPEFIEGGGMTQ